MITFSSFFPDAATRLSTLAIELPRSITPAVAGLTVGLFFGVVGVIAVFVFVGRGQRRSSRRARLGADEVVFIPPYGTMRRDTPLPPRAFAPQPQAPSVHAPVPGYGFRPSSALSARVFAKMGHRDDDADALDYVGAGVVERATEVADSPSADPMVTVDVDFADSEVFQAASLPPAVLVAPVMMVSAEKSAPHPLGIIKSTSEAMRPASVSVSAASTSSGASISELSFDDSPTEIGETYFDEPPHPRRRTDPPRIRAIAPAGPRFPEKTPRMPQVAPAKNDRQHP
jgi:hypothetical protein